MTFEDIDNDGIIIDESKSDNNNPLEIIQRSSYYAFGLELPGLNAVAADPEMDYKYNGKELNSEFALGWSNYGFRFYDPSIARFTGVDPISESYPHVTVYNYAENRPIDGIDLWGLQYVNFNDAKIEYKNGIASYKRSNMSGTTGNYLDTRGPSTVPTSSGSSVMGINVIGPGIGASLIQLGRVREPHKSGPGMIVEKRSSNSKMTRKMRKTYLNNNLKVPTKTYAGPAGKGGRNYAAAVDVMMYNYDYFTSIGTATELNVARNQYSKYTALIDQAIVSGIDSGLIPQDLQSEDRLSDIGNYIFQGYFTNTYDEDTFNAMRETSQLLIQQAPGATLNCDQCQQTQSVPK